MIRSRVNGQVAESVPVDDRGLNYGDGVFESIACFAGQPSFWHQHVARLYGGCQRLGLVAPAEPWLREEVKAVLGQSDAVVKIVVTRGSGPRGYRADPQQPPRVILSASALDKKLAARRADGVAVRRCSTRLASGHALAGIKHLNRLEQVLARAEWDDADIAEGLMFSADGDLIEGTMSNVFLEWEGQLLTPQLDRCGVAGIMRGQLMGLAAQMQIPVRIEKVAASELDACPALFVCNSVIGIWPVRRLDDRPLPIGPLTRRLTAALPSEFQAP